MRKKIKFFGQEDDRDRSRRNNSRIWRLLQSIKESQAVKHREMGGEYLAIDLVFQILVLLPVKSLVRFSCSCKAWFKLINSSTFAKLHLNLTENTLIFLNPNRNCLNSTFYVDKHGFESPSIFPTDQYLKQEKLGHMHYIEVLQNSKIKIKELGITFCGHILATCDGLVLVKLEKGLVVMNPVTRKLLRYPLGTLPPRSKTESYGFMYSNSERRYKVVHLFFDERSHVGCEILSVGTKSWRGIDGTSFGLIRKFTHEAVSAIGALHWFPDVSMCSYIVSMDTESEKFFNITLPKNCKETDRLIELWGVLGLVTHPDMLTMEIWVYTGGLEYGKTWRKQHLIHLNYEIYDFVPVTTSKNGREILFSNSRRYCDVFLVYDYQHQKMKRIEMEEAVDWKSNGHCFPFVNSIISWENSEDLQ